jgi:alpha-methylacyl-CoA racemase
LSGVLSGIGRAGEAPVPPLNLVGDYGGGGMLLALGVVSALLNVHRGGKGQVVDAAMIEGAAQLGAVIWGLIASGNWRESRGSNLLGWRHPGTTAIAPGMASTCRWAPWSRVSTRN